MWQIAHRGHSQAYGDNNMNSFRQAVSAGFEMIELDIQLCGSGEIVVYHDIFIDKHYICHSDYDTLRKLGVILLEDVFQEFRCSEIRLFLDIKGSATVSTSLIQLIRKWFSLDQMKRIFVSGFTRLFVDSIVSSNLDIHIGFTTSNCFTREQLSVLIKNCSFVCIDWSSLEHSTIDFLHSQGILVFSYTCHNEFSMNHMLQFPLDGIVSNFPLIP